MIFKRADILLPKDADMSKWSVVACDQYTSEPRYWQEVEEYTKDALTSYNLILPEVYLEDNDVDDRIEKINTNMADCLNKDAFSLYPNCYIYVERTLRNGSVRKGVVGCIDPEEYDYAKGSKSRVRATEKTVVERIPPRLKVRKNAPVELPHVMVLLDDEKREIIEKLADKKDKFIKVYDFDMMMNSGHITGYVIDDETAKELEAKLEKLNDIDAFNSKYGVNEESPLVFAVGDGNHSLATAKEYYRQIKENIIDGSIEMARYALCEIVNLHDSSLEFEAIHRVVFDIDWDNFQKEFLSFAKEGGGEQSFYLVKDGKKTLWSVINPTANITVGSVQNFIDGYLAANAGKVDYIHGEDVVLELSKANNIGIILDAMEKSELYKTVTVDGALPRKTFSMGEACDKRFYTEVRKIRG